MIINTTAEKSSRKVLKNTWNSPLSKNQRRDFILSSIYIFLHNKKTPVYYGELERYFTGIFDSEHLKYGLRQLKLGKIISYRTKNKEIPPFSLVSLREG